MAPPLQGSNVDFDFWSSKSPLRAPPCGDWLLVKPLLFSPAACCLFILTALFANIKQTPCISPALLWHNFGQSRTHFHGHPPPSPRGGWMGGAWLQMTSALVVPVYKCCIYDIKVTYRSIGLGAHCYPVVENVYYNTCHYNK